MKTGCKSHRGGWPLALPDLHCRVYRGVAKAAINSGCISLGGLARREFSGGSLFDDLFEFDRDAGWVFSVSEIQWYSGRREAFVVVDYGDLFGQISLPDLKPTFLPFHPQVS